MRRLTGRARDYKYSENYELIDETLSNQSVYNRLGALEDVMEIIKDQFDFRFITEKEQDKETYYIEFTKKNASAPLKWDKVFIQLNNRDEYYTMQDILFGGLL